MQILNYKGTVLKGDGSFSDSVLKKAGELFSEKLDLKECDTEKLGFEIEIYRSEELGDGYSVEATEKRIVLSYGKEICNIFAALGRLISEASFDLKGAVSFPCKKIIHKFDIGLRGMYFATHFYNFYHEAPINEVYSVIDDLALRGCNALLVWFDMHHYENTSTPEARKMTERLKSILSYSESIGLAPSMLLLANEGFLGTPEEIAAENKLQNGYTTLMEGYYNTEICPSKKGGLEELLKQRQEVFEAFSGVSVKYLTIWPYDQGGCSCAGCAPWGINGYMRLLPYIKKMAKKYFPNAEIIVSTWLFDRFTSGEWDGMAKILDKGNPVDCEYMMSYFLDGFPKAFENKNYSEKVSFISFPEISMRADPWGGFGSAPTPKFLEDNSMKDFYKGGFPYSEGIFEDINKFVCLRSFSGYKESFTDSVREYLRIEFASESEKLFDAVTAMEETLPRSVSEKDGVIHCDIVAPDKIEMIFKAVIEADAQLTEKIKNTAKWRMLYCRAVIDMELVKNGGVPSKSSECQERFAELIKIYHAENALEYVKPPIGK